MMGLGFHNLSHGATNRKIPGGTLIVLHSAAPPCYNGLKKSRKPCHKSLFPPKALIGFQMPAR